MAYLALQAVSEAVYATLNVAGLTALATGGISDDPAQGTAFPFVLYRVSEPNNEAGFGTGDVPEIQIRVYVFSQYQGMREAQLIAGKVKELLKDATLTVTGYAQAGKVFWDQTVTLDDSEFNGVKVREIVVDFRTYVEAT